MRTTIIILSIALVAAIALGLYLYETEYRKVVDENYQLKKELKDLKFGIPNLLKKAEEFYELEDYKQAKDKIQEMVNRYPNATETTKAKKMLPVIEDELLWSEVANSKNTEEVQKYIQKHPKGRHIKTAKKRKKNILVEQDKQAFQSAEYSHTISAYETYLYSYPDGNYHSKAKGKIKDIEQQEKVNAYESAKLANTSSRWKMFLASYPNHPEKYSIETKIIELEVNEILGDSNTGKLPSFNQTSYGTSYSSNVTIKNDTGYELIVRYSGASTRKIVIPRGGNKTTTLTSGTYKIAATANSLHYAGREQLNGNYTSSYYIRSSYY